jgi:hypothetical protein
VGDERLKGPRLTMMARRRTNVGHSWRISDGVMVDLGVATHDVRVEPHCDQDLSLELAPPIASASETGPGGKGSAQND